MPTDVEPAELDTADDEADGEVLDRVACEIAPATQLVPARGEEPLGERAAAVGTGTGFGVTDGVVTEGMVIGGNFTGGVVTVGIVTVGALTVGTVTVGTETVGVATDGTVTDGTVKARLACGSTAKIGNRASATSAIPATARHARETSSRDTHERRPPDPGPLDLPPVHPLIAWDMYPSLRKLNRFTRDHGSPVKRPAVVASHLVEWPVCGPGSWTAPDIEVGSFHVRYRGLCGQPRGAA